MTRLPPHKADDLSFVSRKPEGGYNYWSVQPTGDREVDYATGQRLGDEFLAFIGCFPSYGNSTLLPSIVNDMIVARRDKASKWGQHLSGIESGFLRQVTGYAMAAARVVAQTPDQPTAA